MHNFIHLCIQIFLADYPWQTIWLDLNHHGNTPVHTSGRGLLERTAEVGRRPWVGCTILWTQVLDWTNGGSWTVSQHLSWVRKQREIPQATVNWLPRLSCFSGPHFQTRGQSKPSLHVSCAAMRTVTNMHVDMWTAYIVAMRKAANTREYFPLLSILYTSCKPISMNTVARGNRLDLSLLPALLYVFNLALVFGDIVSDSPICWLPWARTCWTPDPLHLQPLPPEDDSQSDITMPAQC